jgi:prepilin-type processing-associated H-X9-DG protein
MGPSMFTMMLPYIEQQNQVPLVTGTTSAAWDNAKPVKTYICPSRRSTTGMTAGKEDYAAATDDSFWFNDPQKYKPIIFGAGGGNPVPRGQPVSLANVTSADGTSNTLLLAHKGMDPSGYTTGTASGDDLTWAYPVLWPPRPNPTPFPTYYNYQHFRSPYGFVQDTGVVPCGTGIGGYQASPDYSNMVHSMASPHPGAMPAVFADGSVRGITYSINNTICSWLWFYNDGVTVTLN